MDAAAPVAESKKKKPKKRWSKEDKRKHNLQKKIVNNNQQRSKTQRLYQCARNVSHTQAVLFPENEVSSDITVRTTSNLDSLKDSSSAPLSIHAKPLLILDLNGILCHRIRDKNQHTNIPYRRAIELIAATPIVTRPNLAEFLNVLDAHFCLAVWTSAKSKTAKKLVKILIPDNIREKLLFVWSQGQCKPVQKSDEIIFQKSLHKVYLKYPLWNTSNTLLLDDSPEKCIDRCNTLHPPSLHGKQQQKLNKATTIALLSDEKNASLQLEFFHQVAQFFAEPKDDDASAFRTFLKNQGRNHMGWRGDVSQ